MTKTIQIGAWNGDQQSVEVGDNATLRDALSIAGIQPARTQQIVSYSDAANIEMDEMVRDGETYLLTGNQTSGE